MARSRRRVWILRAALVGLMALVASGLTGCQPPRSYVALGDSYTAGPLIPVQQTNPAGCLRSDHNYPHLVAPSLNLPAFRDVSCSGATTADMTQSQDVSPGPNPPQFDALDSNTAAVSLTIGGNDIGFSEIAENCSSALNSGTPCQDRYVVNGRDTISDRIVATAPKVAAVLRGIHQRAPSANVFVLAYLAILPDNGVGCHPQMPITDGDVPYLRDRQKQLNAMLATQAAANNARYVDTYTASIGHDACQLPTARWVEPVVPINPAAPIHPNLAGMQGSAYVLRAAMRQSGL
jgi:lysophospholipase L1-like esterase